MLNIINGSITDSKDPIAHQCNCVSKKTLGVARTIFDAFPYSNCYAIRSTPDTPGTLNIASGKVIVLNMFSQYYPGPPNESNDTEQLRKEWFIKCLVQIHVNNINTVSFPYGIGSGLAKGNFDFYMEAINKFAKYKTVNLYKLTNN